MIQKLKSFRESKINNTNIRILWKSNKRHNHFFEMGDYGLIRSAYNNKGEIKMYWRMLRTPFIVKDVLIENDETYFIIEVIGHFENKIFKIRNYYQFKKHVDDINLIITTKYLKTAFELIINEFRKIGNYYFLKGNSDYFLKKYGTRNPIARIDKELRFDIEKIKSRRDIIKFMHKDKILFAYSFCTGLYWTRAKNEILENLPLNGLFYYSHIHGHGEIIHSSEIGFRAEPVAPYSFCGYSSNECIDCLKLNRKKKIYCLFKIPR
ncbi:MAG: hypothetical protein KJI71_01505 [Patescibacteria group bacterium]|nr:hypothetical protein [Patescibacteria group bacterium]